MIQKSPIRLPMTVEAEGINMNKLRQTFISKESGVLFFAKVYDVA
jgi:hypothetical protein